MELTKEEAKVILNLYEQLEGLQKAEDVYTLQLPILSTYAIKKKLEKYIAEG